MVCKNFHLIPPGYFHWKILWKSTKAKKSAKSASPWVYHWIPSLKRNVIYSQTNWNQWKFKPPRDSIIHFFQLTVKLIVGNSLCNVQSLKMTSNVPEGTKFLDKGLIGIVFIRTPLKPRILNSKQFFYVLHFSV